MMSTPQTLATSEKKKSGMGNFTVQGSTAEASSVVVVLALPGP